MNVEPYRLLRNTRGFRAAAIALSFLAALTAAPASADNVVVGNGTAASCTTAALSAAMTQLIVGTQAPGGTMTFCLRS